jgi:tripartite-type tricarboxylate transporter receptor subunit TctC
MQADRLGALPRLPRDAGSERTTRPTIWRKLSSVIRTAAKIDITHVPYRGAAPALNDLLGGQIPLIWASPVAVLPYVEQGKVRMLGVSTQQRDRMLPQVPTISESGVPGFDTENWFGVAAPAKVSPEVVARVGHAIREATELPDLQRRMSTLGFKLDFRNSEQFRELIVRDHQKYGAIIREAGIQTN